MGWTFGNLHIQKKSGINVDTLIQQGKDYYAQLGYRS